MTKMTFTFGVIDTPGSTLKAVYAYLSGLDTTKPWQVTIEPYKADRSASQNRLAFRWYSEIAQQSPQDTADGWRAVSKLTLGVPILRIENDDFRDQYDRMIKPLSYEDKLELMGAPIDFPVTSLMKVKQFTMYLDAMQRHFAEQGVILTAGDELFNEAMGRKKEPLT